MNAKIEKNHSSSVFLVPVLVKRICLVLKMNDMQYSNGDEVLGGALNFRTGKKEAPDLLTDASSEGTEDDRTSKLASAFRTIIEVCILIRNV